MSNALGADGSHRLAWWLYFVVVGSMVVTITLVGPMVYSAQKLNERLIYQQREIDRLEMLLKLPKLPSDGDGPSLKELIQELDKPAQNHPTETERPAE